ncbi:hypothetical protein [Streptomyces sp. NRRL F-5065]|uniref:hypothetical protein n=1 Tax=Streptomyces sp. NRRL F-5065 TaxID=1463855 RepID=UPI00131ACF9B|nr:hypothetical protein [Streptomyces sp. NRRL F-5065]
MTRRRPVTRARSGSALVAALLAVLVPAVAGCGAEEERRDYSVPGALCGVRVDAQELTPFLPPGKKLSVKPVVNPASTWCDVSVDGKLAVRTVQNWWQGGHDTAHFLRGQTLERVEQSADGGRYVYSGWQAFGKTKDCVDKNYGQELYTGVQAYGSDHRDADAMKRLIVSFTETVETSDACDR